MVGFVVEGFGFRVMNILEGFGLKDFGYRVRNMI